MKKSPASSAGGEAEGIETQPAMKARKISLQPGINAKKTSQ
jgi:hypothetical protein